MFAALLENIRFVSAQNACKSRGAVRMRQIRAHTIAVNARGRRKEAGARAEDTEKAIVAHIETITAGMGVIFVKRSSPPNSARTERRLILAEGRAHAASAHIPPMKKARR